MRAVPAGGVGECPVGPVLLANRQVVGRILVVRIVPRATGITVRPGYGGPLAAWLPTFGRNPGARSRRPFCLLPVEALMPRSWCSAKRWIVTGAAAWLVGGGAALPPAPAAEPTQSTTDRPANQSGLTTISWIAVAGDTVDGDVPALYRLPGATSYATESREPIVAHVARPSLAVVAPSPPLVVDKVADGVPRVAQREIPPSSPWPARESTTTRAESTPLPLSRANPRLAPMTTALAPQLLPAVQRGYALAQRGAMFAARAEFVQVLGRVVQAKDAASNSNVHSQALAAGLRAIDEAEDFVPSGVRVEAELDVRIVSSSHRTPVLGDGVGDVSPHEAVAQYHRFAQEQLAAAVAGEQAGSMALHGLGKVSATLAERGSGDPALVRSATTMYSAALATCPMNHLAANELGVLLVREGRVAEAARLFERTIDLAPSATVYHNLAIAQGKLGFHGHAAANEQESQRLATMERETGAVSRRAGIEWVTPDQMSGIAQPGLTPTAQVPPQPKSRWRKTVEMAKALPFPGASMMK